eukprot:m.16112 g.16112  ORF g.16112 m.16112 type:complete len:130 (+) comp8007_c0_seq1:335-724(+)
MPVDKGFQIEPARSSRSTCERCKDKIDRHELRIKEIYQGAVSGYGRSTSHWYHLPCFFQHQLHPRHTTKKLQDVSELDGYEELDDEDKKTIEDAISDFTSRLKEQREGDRMAGKTPGETAEIPTVTRKA